MTINSNTLISRCSFEYPFEFEFVKASNLSTQTEDALGRTRWGTYSFPDVIRFDRGLDGERELGELFKQCVPAIQLDTFPFLEYNRDSGRYQIPARQAKLFFQAIRQLQSDGLSICISTKIFQRTLENLQEHGYMTPLEVEDCQTTIQSHVLIKDVEREVSDERSIEKAVALAYLYRDRYQSALHESHKFDAQEKAIDWLLSIERYSLQKKANASSWLQSWVWSRNPELARLMDLHEFLEGFERLSSIPDSEEVLQALGDCSTLKELYLEYGGYNQELVTKIGALLKRTQSIERVTISNDGVREDYKLNARTIEPIAQVLRTNASITHLDISCSKLGDEGALQIIEAIRDNPHSKIVHLNLFSCYLTDVSIKRFMEIIQEGGQIPRMINIFYNSRVTDSVAEAYEKMRAFNTAMATSTPS